MNNPVVGMCVLDGGTLCVKWANEAYNSLFMERLRTCNLVGKSLTELVSAETAATLTDIARRTATTLVPYINTEFELCGPDLSPIYWSWSLLPLPAETDSPDLMMVAVAVTEQVTARRRIEDMAHRLAESLGQLEAVVHSMSEGLVVGDMSGSVLIMNPAAVQQFRFRDDEEIRRTILDYNDTFTVHTLEGELLDILDWPLGRAMRGDAFSGLDLRMQRRDGGESWVMNFSGSQLKNADNQPVLALITCRDVTAQKEYEAQLRTKELEVSALNERLQHAMRETHHRVKNNLQFIAASLDLQTMEYRDTVPTTNIQRITTQIQTLAIIQDLLTRDAREDEQLQFVSAKEILEQLLPLLHRMAPDKQMAFEIAEVRLTSRQVTAVALIVNELVTNAIKHGTGCIAVRLHTERASAILEVTDEGAGFPPDFSAAEYGNTGLELVTMFTRSDLGGAVTYDNRSAGGGRVRVMFEYDREVIDGAPPRSAK